MNDLIIKDDKLLEALESIKQSIEEVDDIQQLQKISQLSSGFEKAWHNYYKSSGFGFEQMFLGWETKVRSERKMGEILPTIIKHGGDAVRRLHDETSELEDLGITKIQSYRFQQLAKIPVDKFNQKIEELRVKFMEPTTKALFAAAHVSHNSGENEWYTPKTYIEAARRAMGSIDLDPASSHKANETVQATNYYTLEDDGLYQKWFGNVWMNPPYSQPEIERFAEKIAKSYADKDIKQACVLVNNATETNWFQMMLKEAAALCFHKGRIRFISAEGKLGEAPLQGQAILYFGANTTAFAEEFSAFGQILWKNEER